MFTNLKICVSQKYNYVSIIEYQKHDLSYIHCLLFLNYYNTLHKIFQIADFIKVELYSSEIDKEDSILVEIVKSYIWFKNSLGLIILTYLLLSF